MLWLVDQGFDVLTFDYPGFGRSGGEAEVQNSIAASLAVINFAKDKFPEVDLILYGQSFGAALAAYVAGEEEVKNQIKAVVLESGFASYRQIIRDKIQNFYLTYPFAYPVSWFFSDRYAAKRYIDRLSPIPVLIAHAKSDPIVPFYHSEKLFSAALSPKVMLSQTGSSHSGIFWQKQAQEVLLKFLTEALVMSNDHSKKRI